ncbi:MAG: inorganic diphosphatase [Pseudomonadota bacterium]
MQPLLLERIWHFFDHYKDLEPNKWVQVQEWQGIDVAERLIQEGLNNVSSTA